MENEAGMIDISVVVPTFNRRELLGKCLESLFSQDYDHKRIEIIVVDDGSTDRTPVFLERLAEKKEGLIWKRQKGQGPAAARNKGVKVAKAQIIAFLDDDCVADENWISLMVEAHKKHPQAAAVGGETLILNKKGCVGVSQFLSTCSIETDVCGQKEVVFFPTCNVSLKRRVFNQVLFNEGFPFPGGEDLEFFWSLFKQGHKFIWDRSIKVIHHRDGTFRSFLKQSYLYGRGNLLVSYLHKDHPLLRELSSQGVVFWRGSLFNILKIPWFSTVMTKNMINKEGIKGVSAAAMIFMCFFLHKVLYVCGNIREFFQIQKKND